MLLHFHHSSLLVHDYLRDTLTLELTFKAWWKMVCTYKYDILGKHKTVKTRNYKSFSFTTNNCKNVGKFASMVERTKKKITTPTSHNISVSMN